MFNRGFAVQLGNTYRGKVFSPWSYNVTVMMSDIAGCLTGGTCWVQVMCTNYQQVSSVGRGITGEHMTITTITVYPITSIATLLQEPGDKPMNIFS